MRPRHAVISALPTVVLLGACIGGSDDPPMSMDQLADTGEACPVGLDAAAADAGLGEAGVDVQVEVSRGSGDGGMEDSAIDRAGGVWVECTRPIEGDGESGEITSYLFASEEPAAILLLLPVIARDLELGSDDLEDIAGDLADRFTTADEGELLDLGADGAAAAARLEVEEAASAVLYVGSTDGSASPSQVRSVAEHLLDGL
jgi:hypothetical protein